MIPQQALEIHIKLDAPPRLLAHHTLVHQIAARLLLKLTEYWPNLEIDEDAVLFGAATHDIGKAEVRRELSEPGCDHEILGFAVLMENSIPLPLARFAKSHGLGSELDGLEDLLVCLADKCWKGKRDEELEEKFVRVLCQSEGVDFWDAYPKMTALFDVVSLGTDARLAIQNEFPCEDQDPEPVTTLHRNPEGPQAFDYHLERVVKYFQENYPAAAWSEVRFYEGDPCDRERFSVGDFVAPEDYRRRFCELLEQGHGWINFTACGVLNDWFIIGVVWPSYENSVPREYVSVNLSGPYLDQDGNGRWDLSDRIVLDG